MLRRSCAAALLLALLAMPADAQLITAPSQSAFDLALPGPLRAGRFYGPLVATSPTGAALAAANTLYAEPFFVGAPSTLKSLSFNITVGNAAAWNARLCVYADNGLGAPGTLASGGDTGAVAIGSGSVTGAQTATLNGATGIVLPGPGWYWLAFMADATGETITSANGGVFVGQRLTGDTVVGGLFNAAGVLGYSIAQTFGACPGTYGAGTLLRNAVMVYLVAGF